jgi:hypothetical protein
MTGANLCTAKLVLSEAILSGVKNLNYEQLESRPNNEKEIEITTPRWIKTLFV